MSSDSPEEQNHLPMMDGHAQAADHVQDQQHHDHDHDHADQAPEQPQQDGADITSDAATSPPEPVLQPAAPLTDEWRELLEMDLEDLPHLHPGTLSADIPEQPQAAPIAASDAPADSAVVPVAVAQMEPEAEHEQTPAPAASRIRVNRSVIRPASASVPATPIAAAVVAVDEGQNHAQSHAGSGTAAAPVPVQASSQPQAHAAVKAAGVGAGISISIDVTPPRPKSALRQKWEKLGGRGLTLSIAIHAILLVVAGYWVIHRNVEPSVDFLPGGGSAKGRAASQEVQHQVKQKKSTWLRKSVPMTKLATDKASDIALPDLPPDLMTMPRAAQMLAAPKLGGGLGFGPSSGAGNVGGITFQPFSMFGHTIKARRMAFVLDISPTMQPYLPRVIAEVERVARGSVVVLYSGCGMEPPRPEDLDGMDDSLYGTSTVQFEKYWRLKGATSDEVKRYTIDRNKPIPNEALFRILARRPLTYFIHNLGISYSWKALLCDEIRNADAIYWFTDFDDYCDLKQLEIVAENLLNRRQRLYVHPYEHGTSFEKVRTQIVEPTQGEVIERTVQ